MTSVAIEGLTVEASGRLLLDAVTFSVADGQVAAVVGSSGAGKTSLLRAIAGLQPVAAGTVRFDGLDVTRLPPAERDVGLAAQHPALYPHRSVRRNIAFPLELRHAHIDEIRARVGAEARAAHIERLLECSPQRLSAGEAHLVQVVRAMVKQPRVLLLDEPFAHLDRPRADLLRRELALIQRGFAVTTVVALNRPADAMALGDLLVVLEAGRVTQVGAPLDVYEHPYTAAAAWSTGDAEVIEVRVERDGIGSWLVCDGIRLRAWPPGLRSHGGRRLQMIVRPEWWQIDARGTMVAEVLTVERFGGRTALECRVGDTRIAVDAGATSEAAARSARPGDRVGLRLARYVLIDPRSGFRLDI